MSEERYVDMYEMGADFAAKFSEFIKQRFGVEGEDLDAVLDGFWENA